MIVQEGRILSFDELHELQTSLLLVSKLVTHVTINTFQI